VRPNRRPSDFRSLDNSSSSNAHVRDLHRRIDLNINERRRTHTDETNDETTGLRCLAETFARGGGVSRRDTSGCSHLRYQRPAGLRCVRECIQEVLINRSVPRHVHVILFKRAF
jgi:hypothetical protein